MSMPLGCLSNDIPIMFLVCIWTGVLAPTNPCTCWQQLMVQIPGRSVPVFKDLLNCYCKVIVSKADLVGRLRVLSEGPGTG